MNYTDSCHAEQLTEHDPATNAECIYREAIGSTEPVPIAEGDLEKIRETWRPDMSTVRVLHDERPLPCSRCGALIDRAFTDAHDEWHRSLPWGK